MEKALKEIIQFNEERDWDQFHSPDATGINFTVQRIWPSRSLSRPASCWNVFNGGQIMIVRKSVRNWQMS